MRIMNGRKVNWGREGSSWGEMNESDEWVQCKRPYNISRDLENATHIHSKLIDLAIF